MPTKQPDGHIALPASGRGPGVLVLHAWWGLNGTMKTLCSRLAESGFVAFAPDLFQGKVATTIAGAEELIQSASAERVRADVAQATKFLDERTGRAPGGIAVVGFSFGAYYALEHSVTDPDHVHSVVIFYGTGVEDFIGSKATYLGHFGETDEFEPQAGVDAMETAIKHAGRPVTCHVYPGTGHWFFEADRMDAFNAAAAGLAWDRTLAFLRRSSSA